VEVQWRHVWFWCVCIKVGGGGTVEACVVLVCVYKGGRWRYSGGMCRAGVCVYKGGRWRYSGGMCGSGVCV